MSNNSTHSDVNSSKKTTNYDIKQVVKLLTKVPFCLALEIPSVRYLCTCK